MTPNFKSFRIRPVSPRLSDLGARKVVAWSSQPFGTNAHVRAWVGEQELTGISIDQFGLAFEGFAADVPGENDTLTVQIDGGEKTDTGLTADGEPGVA
jgi:hypothetical protein